ncbi:hypothetical protein [Hydrogenophaga sp. 5NK40-0174]|uniref:hypothetical protein n=1 Tax=Hydrogenophaga sp. 5NK40-0174 TaxID=3127649 RepID=UPI0031090B56
MTNGEELNADTVAMEGDSEWQPTLAEDVFQPDIKVQVTWRDIENAVVRGAIVPAEAYSLWAQWAAPGSPNRIEEGTGRGAAEPAAPQAPMMQAPQQQSATSGRTPMPPVRRLQGEMPEVAWARHGSQGADDLDAPLASSGGTGSMLALILGVILLVGALALFMLAGWEGFGHYGLGGLAGAYAVGAFLLAFSLFRRGHRATGGFVTGLAVLLVPVALWALRTGVVTL